MRSLQSVYFLSIPFNDETNWVVLQTFLMVLEVDQLMKMNLFCKDSDEDLFWRMVALVPLVAKYLAASDGNHNFDYFCLKFVSTQSCYQLQTLSH